MFSQWFSITNTVLFDPEFEPVMQSKPSNWSAVNFKKKTNKQLNSMNLNWSHGTGHMGIHARTAVVRSYGHQNQIFSHRWLTVFSYSWCYASAPSAQDTPL